MLQQNLQATSPKVSNAEVEHPLGKDVDPVDGRTSDLALGNPLSHDFLLFHLVVSRLDCWAAGRLTLGSRTCGEYLLEP